MHLERPSELDRTLGFYGPRDFVHGSPTPPEKKAARLQALALDTLRFTGDVPYRFYLSIQQKLRVDMLTVVADLA